MLYVLNCGHTVPDTGDIEFGDRYRCDECPDHPTRWVVSRRSS